MYSVCAAYICLYSVKFYGFVDSGVSGQTRKIRRMPVFPPTASLPSSSLPSAYSPHPSLSRSPQTHLPYFPAHFSPSLSHAPRSRLPPLLLPCPAALSPSLYSPFASPCPPPLPLSASPVATPFPTCHLRPLTHPPLPSPYQLFSAPTAISPVLLPLSLPPHPSPCLLPSAHAPFPSL